MARSIASRPWSNAAWPAMLTIEPSTHPARIGQSANAMASEPAWAATRATRTPLVTTSQATWARMSHRASTTTHAGMSPTNPAEYGIASGPPRPMPLTLDTTPTKPMAPPRSPSRRRGTTSTRMRMTTRVAREATVDQTRMVGLPPTTCAMSAPSEGRITSVAATRRPRRAYRPVSLWSAGSVVEGRGVDMVRGLWQRVDDAVGRRSPARTRPRRSRTSGGWAPPPECRSRTPACMVPVRVWWRGRRVGPVIRNLAHPGVEGLAAARYNRGPPERE